MYSRLYRIGVLLLLAGWLVAGPALSQPPERPRPEFPMPPPFGGAALAANERFVYVLQGGMLYQYDARDLTLLKRVRLPGEDRGPGKQPADRPPREKDCDRPPAK